jgi:cyanophycin synthetase
VVTNISGDHLGSGGIETMDDLAAIKALVAEQIARRGQLVLNADDRRSFRTGLAPGDPMLVVYEKLEPVCSVLRHLGAQRPSAGQG